MSQRMQAAPTISYESASPADELSVDRDAYHVRVTVAPLATWRMLSRGLIVAIVALGLIVLAILASICAITFQGGRGPELLGPVLRLVIYGLGFAAAVSIAYARLHRWTTFSVTADRLLLNMRTLSRDGRTVSWPRSQIIEIRAIPSSGKLMIRIRNHNLLEIFISPRSALVERVARELNEAMTSPLEPSPMPSMPVTRRIERGRARRPSASRRAVDIVLATVGGIAVIASFFIPVLFWVLVAAAIPLGIWFGTQDKEYFA